MKRYLLYPFLLSLIFSAVACGKKGPLQPPIVRIPKNAEILELTQRGDKVFLKWKNPTLYIDGNPVLDLAGVEIWVLEKDRTGIKAEKQPVDSELEAVPDWNKEYKNEGKLLKVIDKEEFEDYSLNSEQEVLEMVFVHPLPQGFLNKKYYFSLRVMDIRGRRSDYAAPRSLEATVLPIPPQNFKATVSVGKIILQWDLPPTNIDQSAPPLVKGYNIYRSTDQAVPVRLNPTLIKELLFEDRAFVFDTTYRYWIRASATETAPFLESEDSMVLELTPKDTFPPSPPQGLVIVAGAEILSLSWDASAEADLGGYRVWRKGESEEEFLLLTESPIMENAYTDTAVEKNRRYYYAITSLDKIGNESPKSNTVSGILRIGQK